MDHGRGVFALLQEEGAGFVDPGIRAVFMDRDALGGRFGLHMARRGHDGFAGLLR